MTSGRTKRKGAGSIVFGIAAGLAAAVASYHWVTAPVSRDGRQAEEAAVSASRAILADRLGIPAPEIVDPLAPRRPVGKTYVYPSGDGGFEVSGYYRRGPGDDWHAYLLRLDAGHAPIELKVRDDDPAIAERGARDPLLDVLP